MSSWERHYVKWKVSSFSVVSIFVWPLKWSGSLTFHCSLVFSDQFDNIDSQESHCTIGTANWDNMGCSDLIRLKSTRSVSSRCLTLLDWRALSISLTVWGWIDPFLRTAMFHVSLTGTGKKVSPTKSSNSGGVLSEMLHEPFGFQWILILLRASLMSDPPGR